MFHVKHCPFYFYLLSRHCELLQHGFLDGEVHGDAATHHQIQFALDPVSYTHLTLPTILRV